MQRKSSKKTRAANSNEKAFCSWIKQQPCCTCGQSAPSIADHVRGSAYKIKYNYVTVLVGHWYLIPLCSACDSVKTLGSHKVFYAHFGKTQRELWLKVVEDYNKEIPDEVICAIKQDF